MVVVEGVSVTVAVERASVIVGVERARSSSLGGRAATR